MSENIQLEIERYYQEAGLNAWSQRQIPYEISSNRFLAKRYARLIIAWLYDLKLAQKLPTAHPVTIIEVGAGHGLFSWYLLNALLVRHQEDLDKEASPPILEQLGIRIRYLVTDLSKSNIAAIQQRSEFRHLIEEGFIDFASWQAGEQSPLVLEHSGEVLGAGSLQSPTIIVSNYVIDSMPTDNFKISGKNFYRADICSDNEELPLDKRRYHYNFSPLSHEQAHQVYDDPDWQSVLQDYRNENSKLTFSMPTAAIALIRQVKELSNNDEHLLIAGDKGYCSSNHFLNLNTPELSKHECVSHMVNFDAIARYTLKQQGCAFLNNSYKNPTFDVCCYTSLAPTQAALFRQAFHDSFSEFGIHELWCMLTTLNEGTPSLESILSLMNLSCWDPHFFTYLSDALLALPLENIEPLDKETLQLGLEQVELHHFKVHEDFCILYEVARVYYAIDEFDECVRLCKLSLTNSQPFAEAYHCQVMALEILGQIEDAYGVLQELEKHFPDYKPLNGLKINLTKQLAG